MSLVRRLPRQVSIDDLIGAGWRGLAEALGQREAFRLESEFEAYCAYRVQGAILDYLGSLDPVAKRKSGASQHIVAAIRALTGCLGRAPTEVEIAGELGIELEIYRDLLFQIAQSEPVRLEVTDLAQSRPPRRLDVVAKEMRDRVQEAIGMMPPWLQLLLALYYQEQCSFREIGRICGITDTRACQLHSEAIHRIRACVERPSPETRMSLPREDQEAGSEGPP